MRVLVACEFSGIVREAFKARGHDAWSCDLLPTEIPGNHIQRDVLEILNDGWDLMIAHPPCTYLSYSGMAWWNDDGRVWKRLDALKFFAQLWTAPIDKICIENPRSCASPTVAKYSQEIQPYYFGDEEIKTTWLWLKNLSHLIYTHTQDLFNEKTATEKPKPKAFKKNGKALYFTDYFPPTNDRGLIRAKTFPGIAKAMSEQWG